MIGPLLQALWQQVGPTVGPAAQQLFQALSPYMRRVPPYLYISAAKDLSKTVENAYNRLSPEDKENLQMVARWAVRDGLGDAASNVSGIPRPVLDKLLIPLFDKIEELFKDDPEKAIEAKSYVADEILSQVANNPIAKPINGGHTNNQHKFIGEVCIQCGCSKKAVEIFNWDCTPMPSMQQDSHVFVGDVCTKCGCSRQAIKKFNWTCTSLASSDQGR
jgi:hypothetical protein